MAQQYVLGTDSIVAVTESSGTIENVGVETIEILDGTNLNAGQGITLKPGEKKTFDGSVSIRRMGNNGEAKANVVDFNFDGKGGGQYDTMTEAEATAGTNTTGELISAKVLADKIDDRINDVIGTAPAALDTLGELSDALNDDANFAATLATQLAGKADDSVFGASGANAKKGLVPEPDSVAGATKYLREDGTWAVPPNDVYSLPSASVSVKGGIKIGDSFGVDSDVLILEPAKETVVGGIKSSTIDGGINVDTLGNASINLPTAGSTVKGGIKIGNSFDVDSDTLILNPASDTIVGGIKSSTIDGGISVDSVGNATINLPIASDTVLGGVKSSTVIGGVQVDSVGGMTFNLGVADETLLGGVKSSSLDGGVSVNNDGTMSLNKLFYRKQNTMYVVGDIVYHNALAVNQKLVCVKAGTTANSVLTLSSTDEGAYITDGTAAWCIDSLADGNYTAGHGNGIYRGVDVTAYWESGDMSANIQASKFVGFHIGDYITKTVTTVATTYTDKSGTEVTQAAATYSNVKWLVAACDPHLHCGDTGGTTTTHHVLLIPSAALQRNVAMNPTNDTTGGYLGSDMWTVHMSIWATAIKAAFGATHVLSHRELLTDAINATAPSGAGAGWVGIASGLVWTDVEANIPNEQMIYGGRVFGSSYDCGEYPGRLPLFAMKQYVGGDDRSWYWLRAVASASAFAYASGYGLATAIAASHSYSTVGIRPYFLLY